MKTETKATVHICDGCLRQEVQLAGEEMPKGFFLQVIEINGLGGYGGALYVCRERCLTAAFRNRAELWNDHHLHVGQEGE